MRILEALGLSPSEEDKKLRKLVENTYSSVRVVGRGTVKIDPVEVRQSQEFRDVLVQVKYLSNQL